jgi:hypothetical protein
MDVALNGDLLRVAVNPLVGGTITSIDHLGLGMSVLGTTPWDPVPSPYISCAAPDEMTWLSRYGGGWPLLFPNGGDACNFDGVFHGFHGEASVAPWNVETDGTAIRLSRRFFTVPVEMRREISVAGEVVTVRETVRMRGDRPIRVMWTHHPTFGGDLLAGDFEIRTGARGVTVDDSYDPPTNPLKLGADGAWPSLAGKNGPVDLSRPSGKMAALAYLRDLDEAWVTIRRLDNALGVALSWDSRIFPCAWLWYELGGTAEQPWYGRARLLGVEPSTSWPGTGLADIDRRGGRLLTLEPDDEITSVIRLHIFQPTGPAHSVDENGRVIFFRDSS